MNKVRKIGKNTFSLILSSVVFSALAFVLSIFVGRVLGDVALGQYTFAFAFPQILTVFLDLGYATLLIREVSKDKTLAEKYLNNILIFRLFLFPLIFFILFIGINIMGYPENIKNIVYLFGIFTFFRTLTNVFYCIFRAFEKMEYNAYIVIFSTILRSSLGLIILFLGYGLIELGLIFAFSAFAEFIISLILCRKKFVKIKFQVPFSFIKKTYRTALPLGMLTIFGIIYVRIDTVMLSLMKGDAVVGWYNAAYNLVLGFQFIPHLFMHALLPTMSFYSVSSRESLQKTYEKSFKYLFILGLPISVGIFMLADKFMLFFYGKDFINSIVALQILTLNIVLIFLCSCTGFLLISINKQNQMAIAAASLALLNVIMNSFLIPSYSYLGAGIATIATELFLLIIYLYLLKQNSFTCNIKKIFIPASVACCVMGIFLYYFSEIQLILQIFIAIILYIVLLIILKVFNKNDFLLFKQLIKKY